jgi:hypothetical protein
MHKDCDLYEIATTVLSLKIVFQKHQGINKKVFLPLIFPSIRHLIFLMTVAKDKGEHKHL